LGKAWGENQKGGGKVKMLQKKNHQKRSSEFHQGVKKYPTQENPKVGEKGGVDYISPRKEKTEKGPVIWGGGRSDEKPFPVGGKGVQEVGF